MKNQLSDILEHKGHEVHTATPSDSMLDAVLEMCRLHIGALLVLDGERPIGIVTERDVMARVILRDRDPASTTVAETMTLEVVVVQPTTTVAEAMAIMTSKHCRHLPVVDDGGLVVGIVSIGDLVRHLSEEQDFVMRMLTDYVRGG